jgi:hypothetical protein
MSEGAVNALFDLHNPFKDNPFIPPTTTEWLGFPFAVPRIKTEPIHRRGSLHFVIGVQRSGKSTYCTRWSQGLLPKDTVDGFPRVIVCDDELRLAIHGERWKRETEPLVYGIEPYIIRMLLNRHDVIVDETHTTERSILKVLSIDPDATYHLVDTPLDTCIRRAYETDQADLVEPIKRCHRQLEELKAYGLEKKIEELRILARDQRA